MATHFRYGGIFNYIFTAESDSERILKIGQHLPKLWAIKYRVVFFYETRCMYMIHCNAHTHIHTHSYRCSNCNYKQCMYRPNFVSTISQQQMHLAISQAVTRILKNARYSPNLTTLCYHTALSTGEVLRNGYIHLSALIWA